MELLLNREKEKERERCSDNDPFLIALTFYVEDEECVTITNAPESRSGRLCATSN
jgi:hypothetical protein